MYIVCLTSNKYGSGRKYFHLKEERLILIMLQMI